MSTAALDSWRQYRTETERAIMTTYRPELEKRRQARHGNEDRAFAQRASKEVWDEPKPTQRDSR